AGGGLAAGGRGGSRRGGPAVVRAEEHMDQHEIRELFAAAKAGRVSRRAAMRRLVGLGLTAPFAAMLLSRAGLAQAPAKFDYKPAKAGGGGALKTLFWQAPTLLNPHFAVGTKD